MRSIFNTSMCPSWYGLLSLLPVSISWSKYKTASSSLKDPDYEEDDVSSEDDGRFLVWMIIETYAFMMTCVGVCV